MQDTVAETGEGARIEELQSIQCKLLKDLKKLNNFIDSKKLSEIITQLEQPIFHRELLDAFKKIESHYDNASGGDSFDDERVIENRLIEGAKFIVKKYDISESDFDKIAKNYIGLDLIYTDFK